MPRMTRTLRRRPVDSGRAIAAQASAQSSMTGGAPRRRRTGISALAVVVGGCLSACGTGLSAAAGGSATVPGPIPSGLESFYRQAVNWYPCAATDGVEKASDKTAQASASTTAATASAQATAAPSSDGATGTAGSSEEEADTATFSCALVLSSVILAAGFSAMPSSGSATGTAGASEETDDATFSCAVITVPLDYANPKGETISIAVKKRAATGGHAQGALFINPGGPGDSGVSFAERASNAFSPDLLEAYDIIGFDPRGVGSSTAITCSSDDDASGGTAEPSASAEATTNGLTPENSKGRELRLSDFQEPPVTSGWQEKRYDVASITNTMGIGTKLDWQNDDEIELRLANKFQKVTFTAGQANDSRSSDLIVRVAIFADGKEIETVDVPFNDAHAFEVKAANVNALKITFKALDQKQEMPQIDDSTIGVILNVKAE